MGLKGREPEGHTPTSAGSAHTNLRGLGGGARKRERDSSTKQGIFDEKKRGKTGRAGNSAQALFWGGESCTGGWRDRGRESKEGRVGIECGFRQSELSRYYIKKDMTPVCINQK